MTKPEERILYGEAGPDGATPFWRMSTIWSAAAGKPATPVVVESLKILDEVAWFGGPKNVQPTVRRVAAHARDISRADLSYPIIMTKSGDVLDGAHRIAKAVLIGQHLVMAVILDDWPPADGTVQAPSGA